MTAVGPVKPAATPTSPAMAARDAKLRKAAQQMEGAFVEQMYKSMRATVPTDGLFGGGSGEDIFTGLLEQRVASDTPAKWQHGLSDAIFRQMRDAVHKQAGMIVARDTSLALPSTPKTK